jgi:hypothetical protein
VMNQAQRAFVIHVTTEKNTILYCIFFWWQFQDALWRRRNNSYP